MSKTKPQKKAVTADRGQNAAAGPELEAAVRRAVQEALARGLQPQSVTHRSVEPATGVDTDRGGMLGVPPPSGALNWKSNKTTTDGRTFLTSAQIAARWGWHEESVRRKIRRRELASVILGRRRLVPLAEVELLERQGTVPRL